MKPLQQVLYIADLTCQKIWFFVMIPMVEPTSVMGSNIFPSHAPRTHATPVDNIYNDQTYENFKATNSQIFSHMWKSVILNFVDLTMMQTEYTHES